MPAYKCRSTESGNWVSGGGEVSLKIAGDWGGADTLNGGKDQTRDSGESCEL